MNIKKVIQEIETAANTQAQIKSIVIDENGLQELENEESKDYPVFIIEIMNVDVQLSATSAGLVYYFNLICLDAELQGKQNRVDCLSDTLGILQDVFSELFRNGYYSYGTNGQASIITEVAPTHTAGWVMPIQVVGAFTSDTCDVP